MTDPGPEASSDLSRDRLEVLYEVSRTLPSVRDAAELVERMMDLVIKTVKAERGILFLMGANGAPHPEVVRGADDDTVASAAQTSRQIVEQTLAEGAGLRSDDARSDPRFHTPSVMLFHIMSFMCVPLRRGERVLGTLYVDHRSKTDLFSAADLAFFSALADICAVALENSMLHETLRREVRDLRRDVAGKYHFENLLGASESMVRLFRVMERLVDADATVLVQGENGTGKELVARALHFNGKRRDRPFVTVDCGALTPELAASELFGHRRGAFTGAGEDRAGLFEEAQGGTVFLDQIEDLPLSLQPQLLRAVQEGEVRRVGETTYRKVSWRLIAASRVDLGERVRAGQLREDLYYRLRVVPLDVPPLRERLSDIPLLAQHFLDAARKAQGHGPIGFTRKAMEVIVAHRWPGNVRELQHAVQRAALLAGGERVEPEDLALTPGAVESGRAATQDGARSNVEEALRTHGGNVTLAAQALGLTRRGLQKLLRREGVDAAVFRAPKSREP
jgi:transcriptional regulator with GAF, ATPase, and Fis domain